ALQVKKVHYDYGALTQFERSVMRRVAPFYTWTRANVPAVIRQLGESPGGPTAQVIKASTAAKQKEGFEPPYIGEGLGVPVGGRDETGTQRYLTSLGLPAEDAFPFVAGRGLSGNVMRTLGDLPGEASPLLKAPIELATGTQFH